MDETITFEYFYGGQSDSFSFYRIPRLLVTGAQFKSGHTPSDFGRQRPASQGERFCALSAVQGRNGL